jgi:hypothetical protein
MKTGPDAALLAKMREHYQYATLVDYMLVDGELFRRCGICRCAPIPRNARNVMWCETCLEECSNSTESLDAFVARKRTVPRGHGRQDD